MVSEPSDFEALVEALCKAGVEHRVAVDVVLELWPDTAGALGRMAPSGSLLLQTIRELVDAGRANADVVVAAIRCDDRALESLRHVFAAPDGGSTPAWDDLVAVVPALHGLRDEQAARAQALSRRSPRLALVVVVAGIVTLLIVAIVHSGWL